MKRVKKIVSGGLMLAVLQLSACTPHNAESQQLTMRNPASVWCLKRGGQLLQERLSKGDTHYCLLPSGEKIEQWALFHRDHSQ